MRAVDIIIKKRDRQELSQAEIQDFIQGFASGEIPDYQAAAWAMAVVLNGMTIREISDLTLAMAYSGETINLSGVVPIAVDKHSTGGVGDKTTLVVEPTVAACGLAMAKMSGRGLGFTGGTLDKMESIPGFRVDLTTDEFIAQLAQIGLVLSGQTADLAPADGKLYALRDVTGTVNSIPLIASSIMCKKIAGGAQRIVLDVKVGSGAFMKDVASAQELAQTMVNIGQETGRETIALLSDMNQPLGRMVGNAMEVYEAIETLRGGGPPDFHNHCLTVAGYLLLLGGLVQNEQEGARLAEKALTSGHALEKFRQLVQAQGGDESYIDHPEKLPQAAIREPITAPISGFVSKVDAGLVGEASVLLGAGRAKKGDPVDHAVGIEIHHQVGDQVAAGEPLLTLHANQSLALEAARQHLAPALQVAETQVDPLPLFYGVIRPSLPTQS